MPRKMSRKNDPVPDNVMNPALYRKIRNKMRKQHADQGKRWGAYSSGQLVQQYKRAGGKYKSRSSKKSEKKSGKLARWYREKWIDVCAYNRGKIKSCGRKSVESGKFPYCRPLHRVTKKTPKTVKELSKSQRIKLCSKKRKNPKKIIRRSYSFNKMIKLVSIKKSPKKEKKFRATFTLASGKTRTTDFGAAGMSDYTKHRDKERRSRYITRHKKDLRTNDPTRAGYLSMYVLWNKPTVQGSINDYRKRLAKYNKTGKFPKEIK